MIKQSEKTENKFDIQTVLIFMVAIAVGIWVTGLVLPEWLPGLRQSIMGEDIKMFWYISRSSAIFAYVFLWFSMILGLLLSNRLAKIWLGGRVTNEFHNFFSILGLLFTVIHAVILIGDSYLRLNLLNVLAPFGVSNYKPIWVGLGQIGLYLWLILVISFYIKKSLGHASWRLVHYSSFLLFVLALFHGIFSGSDSGTVGMVGLYWVSAASTMFFVVFRVLTALITVNGKVQEAIRS